MTPPHILDQLQNLLSPIQYTHTQEAPMTLNETATVVTDHTEILEQLQTEVTRLGEQVSRIARELHNERQQHESFKVDVRDKLIELGDEHGFDADDALESLGLDPVKREWEVTVTVTATQDVTLTVTAKDEDEALTIAGDAYGEFDDDALFGEASAYGWSFYDREVQYASEA